MTLVIFDLDGTLAKTNEDLADSVNSVRAARGLAPLPVQTVTEYLGCGVRNLMTRSMPELHAEEELEQAIQEQIGFYSQCFTNKTRLYPGVVDTLSKLSTKHTLVVFTNKVMHQAQGLLEKLGVAGCFKCIIGNAPGIPLKPSAEALQYAAKQADCPLEGAWIVGDNWTDILAGHNARIHTCFCQFGFGNPQKMGADASIARFDLLTEVIK